MPSPHKDCLKLDVDVGWKDEEAAAAVLARDAEAVVQGMWFERFRPQSVLEAEAEAILDACDVASYQNCHKVLIGRLLLVWIWDMFTVLAVVEDIKMYLQDYSTVYIFWINHV